MLHLYDINCFYFAFSLRDDFFLYDQYHLHRYLNIKGFKISISSVQLINVISNIFPFQVYFNRCIDWLIFKCRFILNDGRVIIEWCCGIILFLKFFLHKISHSLDFTLNFFLSKTKEIFQMVNNSFNTFILFIILRMIGCTFRIVFGL